MSIIESLSSHRVMAAIEKRADLSNGALAGIAANLRDMIDGLHEVYVPTEGETRTVVEFPMSYRGSIYEDGAVECEANYRALTAEYGEDYRVNEHSSFQLDLCAIVEREDDPCALIGKISEDWDFLRNCPVLDDQVYLETESEMMDEDWERLTGTPAEVLWYLIVTDAVDPYAAPPQGASWQYAVLKPDEFRAAMSAHDASDEAYELID